MARFMLSFRSIFGRAIGVSCLLLVLAASDVVAYTPGETAQRCRPSNGAPSPESPSVRASTSTSTTRRDILIQTQALVLSSLVLGTDSIPTFAQDVPKQVIVVTGSNSGIGFEACKRLAAQGHTLVLACRTIEKAQRAAERIQETTAVTGTLIPAECDLADMKSIRSFADTLKISKINTLCLNAGLSRNTAATDCARTIDGFELTGKRSHAILLFGFALPETC